MHVVIMPIAKKTAGSYECSCDSGYVGDGVECEYINECNDSDTCFDIGSYDCDCDAGYTGDGLKCTDINECIEGIHNCHPDAKCFNSIGGLECTCRNGFEGDENTYVDTDGFECKCESGDMSDGIDWYDANEY